jgi:hypothetical protein
MSSKYIIKPREKWYVKNYKNEYLTFKTDIKISNKFNDSKNDYLYLYGEYNRIPVLTTFAFFLGIDIVNTICMTFKIKDSITENEAIFSFGYFEQSEKRKNIKRSSDGIGKSGYQLPGTSTRSRYFTIGPSYTSKDGEYRSGLISYDNIVIIKTTDILRNIFQDVFDYIQHKSLNRGWIFLKEYFFPTDDKKLYQHELEYNAFQLQSELFSLSWFNFLMCVHLKFVDNHINIKFEKIMFKHIDEDLSFFTNLINIYTIDKLKLFWNISNNIINGNKLPQSYTKNKLGQKLIPLSIAESQNPFDIRYKPWREYIISLYLSNFTVNNISPGFCITNTWFYIKNSRKGLYDNEIQYEKMQNSERAIQITELLSRAQIYTKTNISQSKISKVLNTKLVNKFRTLYDKIQDPINYAKEDIIMSNVTLCVISEYVGRTIWDVILSSKTSDYYNKLIGEPFSLKGFPIFTKYMFELCYNLYCMNSVAGIIHGDLHLNNATLNTINYNSEKKTQSLENPTDMYVLNDGNEQYLFKTSGYFLCIIDFSRSLILPEKITQFVDDSIPKTFTNQKDMKNFYTTQSKQLLNIYMNFFDNNECDKDDLTILFRNSFEAVFKLLTSLDLYGFTDKLLNMYKFNKNNVIKPHKKCIELLEKIKSESERFCVVEMNKLILDKSYELVVAQMEWPNYTIIKNCFYDNLVSNSNVGDIINVYNINNKIKYSLNTIEKYPPLIKEFKEIVNNKETSKDIMKFIKDRKIHEKEKRDGLKVVSFISNRQKQKHI